MKREEESCSLHWIHSLLPYISIFITVKVISLLPYKWIPTTVLLHFIFCTSTSFIFLEYFDTYVLSVQTIRNKVKKTGATFMKRSFWTNTFLTSIIAHKYFQQLQRYVSLLSLHLYYLKFFFTYILNVMIMSTVTNLLYFIDQVNILNTELLLILF